MTTRPIIGLEVHVQLRTRTKLFCGCPVRTDAPPNSCVCPVCLGHPGALPVMNRRAVDHAVLMGLALNCHVARHTKWDRKSYYYPDLPKNYQISQYDLPLARDGYFEIELNGTAKRIRIRRAHLEEDAGKNLHDVSGCTLVDLNRTGTPLLEIVTEPDLSSAEEAFVFCTELHRLAVYLSVSEGSMQKGQMRFEPNVNVAITAGGGEYRTPISEIKNLNSFKAVRDAIAYEADRQASAWNEDHGYLLGRAPNENRGWNAERGVTEFQRGKEAAHDYRYFPDPDLVPVDLTEEMLADIREQLAEPPLARRARFVDDYGLSPTDAETIVNDRKTADLFEEVITRGGPVEIVGKQFVNVWFKLANERGGTLTDLGVDAAWMADLASITHEGTVNKTAANQLAGLIVERVEKMRPSDQPRSMDRATSPPPLVLAKETGLILVQDSAATEAWVEQALGENEQAVRDARTNPKKAKAALGFLRGQVMKISGGKADPKIVGSLIEQKLKRLSD